MRAIWSRRRWTLSANRVRAIGLSGSPGGRTSHSRALLERMLDGLEARGVETGLIDLAGLSANGLLGRAPADDVKAALDAVALAHIVIASTPVYRATYSGLLKTFFDLMPQDALVGKVGVPIATGGAPGHLLVLDFGLRPLFASLGATVVASGVYATDQQFVGGELDASIADRLERSATEALALEARRFIPGATRESSGRERAAVPR